ncbi:MAG: hypothetical protein QOF78_2146 [Phycisphaerales bacterium]|nr:hypothetical protein [Phycisphaerales bacterium]
MKRFLAAAIAVCLSTFAGAAHAGLISSQTDSNPNASNVVDDGTISPGEYSTAYTGGGTGFGGTVGLGTLYLDSDGVNLYLGFQPGSNVNDNFIIHLDSRTGGYTDAQMNDTADPGRNLLTNLTRDVDDPFAILPDFGIVMGGFGQVSFELTTGSLNFLGFENDQAGNSPALAREFEISLATLGNPTSIDFFVSYGADNNYMSNESMPVEAFNAGANPGFDNNGTFSPVVRTNYNQFNVPEPTSMAIAAVGALILSSRSRRRPQKA